MEEIKKQYKPMNKITFAIVYGILIVCTLGLLTFGIWLCLPVNEPQTVEVSGLLENIKIVGSSRYSSGSVTIKVNGKTYKATDGAARAINFEKIDIASVGDTVILEYEKYTNEIRVLNINGVTYLTMKMYLENEHIYRAIPGGFVIFFGAAVAIMDIWIIISKIKKKQKDSN